MKAWLRKKLKFILLGLLAAIIIPVGIGSFNIWRELPELKGKDPKRYDSMIEDFQRMAFFDAYELYVFLHNHTGQEILMMHFRDIRNKWENDKDFRKAEWEKQLKERKADRTQREKGYQRRFEDLEKNGPPDEKAVKARWNKTGPWKKRLILREKCIQYMEQEVMDDRRRKNILDAPGISGRLDHGGRSVADVCGEMIPMGYDPEGVDRALARLKKTMNYYYFSAMAREIGLPEESIFPFTDRLNRMASDFQKG